MEGNMCFYCHLESTDPDFCDRCGRALEVQSITPAIASKWTEQSLTCTTTVTNWNLAEQLKNIQLNCIEIPFASLEEGKHYRNYYGTNKKSLEHFLLAKESLDFELIDKTIYCIAELFKKVNAAGYVFGGVDLGDFWLQDDHLEMMVYRPLRPLMKIGSICEEPEILDFYSQEYINKKELILSSDVYIIGSIFVALLQGKLNALTTLAEMRYVSHQIIPQRKDFQLELFPWMNQSTSIYAEERYVSVEEQMFYYDNYLKSKNVVTPNEIYVAGISDVGNKKRQLEGDESELNQDRYIYLKGKYCIFGFISDGISTAKVGSGSIAAQIVKVVALDLWEQEKELLNGEEAIQSFLMKFVQQANEQIVAKSTELAAHLEEVRSSYLMGTTLVATVCTNEIAYTVSIGDSRIYHWSAESSVKPIHSDQNVRNELLLKGIDWEDVQATEEQASLTYYLGMADTSTKPFIAKEIPVEIRKVEMSSGELLLLCSDGLTDYLNPIGYQNDVWKADSILSDTIHYFAPDNNWEACAQKLGQLANDNGGGDNITVLLVAFHIKQNNERISGGI